MATADGNWQERLFGLPGLTEEEKGRANARILALTEADRELAVPKRTEVAVASIKELLSR